MKKLKRANKNFAEKLGPLRPVKLPYLQPVTPFNMRDSIFWYNTPCQVLNLLDEKKGRINLMGLTPGDSSSFIDHVPNFSTMMEERQSIYSISYIFCSFKFMYFITASG